MNISDLHRRDHGICWLCRCEVDPHEASADHLDPRPPVHAYSMRRPRGKQVRLAHYGCNVARGNLPAAQSIAALGPVWAIEDPDERRLACPPALREALSAYHKAMARMARNMVGLPVSALSDAIRRDAAEAESGWSADVSPICSC